MKKITTTSLLILSAFFGNLYGVEEYYEPVLHCLQGDLRFDVNDMKSSYNEKIDPLIKCFMESNLETFKGESFELFPNDREQRLFYVLHKFSAFSEIVQKKLDKENKKNGF